MFDIGWSEMMMMAVLVIIVVGPKDLPKVLHTAGKWIGRARGLAREFQSGLEDIAREAELDEIKKQVDKTAQDFESSARSMENEVRLSTDLDAITDPSGTEDGVFDDAPKAEAGPDANEVQAAVEQAQNMEPGSEPESGPKSGPESGPESGDNGYSQPTAPAHSVKRGPGPAQDVAGGKPETRTGT